LGVSTGILATLGALNASPALLTQIALVGAIGGSAGAYVSAKVAITDLPQLVAAFHSFVGLAAVLTSVSSFLLHPASGDIVHDVAVYLGTAIGAVTFTGSLVAFGKLQGFVESKAMNIPAVNQSAPVREIST